MTDADLLTSKIEREKLQIEKAKLALEQSFAKKWAVPLLGLAGVIIAGFFSVAAVLVADIFKRAESVALAAQRAATASAEGKDRNDRLQLDVANFVLTNWQNFKATREDRQVVVRVTSEFFPSWASKKVIENIFMPEDGAEKLALQQLLDRLKPKFDLSGIWRCATRCQDITGQVAKITQNDTRLIFTNERGSVSPGVYKTPTEFSAIEWGDGGIVQNEGKEVLWFGGPVWLKVDFPISQTEAAA
jgi:hypothetical protein